MKLPNKLYLLMLIFLLSGCASYEPMSLDERISNRIHCDNPRNSNIVIPLSEDKDISLIAQDYIQAGKSIKAEQFYLGLYDRGLLPDFALYQIFLVYSTWHNANRDMNKAIDYANKIKLEFPESNVNSLISNRLPEYYLNC